MMRTTRIGWAAVAVAALVALGGEGSPAHAALILNDNFSTSTLNAAVPAAPTATSTNYQVLSTKNATASSIAAGSLQLHMVATSSGFNEIQALFAGAPVALTQIGDYVEATLVFVPTGINVQGNSTLNFGLYNSGGSPPVPGTSLNNSQLDDAGVFTTGNAADWQGYVARLGRAGGVSSQIFTRPLQVGSTTAESQDALFTNAGTGAFDDPAGTVIQSGGLGATLTNGTSYTLKLRVTYDAGTSLATINYSIADGGGTIDSLSGVTVAATTIATSFDALAFGYRGTDSAAAPYLLDVRSLTVDTNVAVVPEPMALASIGILLGIVMASCRRRCS